MAARADARDAQSGSRWRSPHRLSQGCELYLVLRNWLRRSAYAFWRDRGDGSSLRPETDASAAARLSRNSCTSLMESRRSSAIASWARSGNPSRIASNIALCWCRRSSCIRDPWRQTAMCRERRRLVCEEGSPGRSGLGWQHAAAALVNTFVQAACGPMRTVRTVIYDLVTVWRLREMTRVRERPLRRNATSMPSSRRKRCGASKPASQCPWRLRRSRPGRR